MRKKSTLSLLLICSLVLSVLAHMYFLIEWTNDRYMVGPNDGLRQMLPFKKLLYEQYTSGNFFYSSHFGLGGGTYSQLAYYFSTSLVFIVTAGIVFLLESANWIEAEGILFWAKSAVFISVLRLTFILFITTLVFRYMKSSWCASFVGASVYGISIIYLRHATYWEFFADAFIWVPMLVFGVEKIIREGKFGWFMIAVALTLFDNFYFAFTNLLFIVVYFLFRWFIRLDENEVGRWKQLELFTMSGLVGSGISTVSFFPAVYGLFNNHRPPYTKPIPLYHWDNVFFASGYVLIPIFFLLFLFTFSYYKNPIFRLFVSISIFLLILHFSPRVASFFNGFSAPQYRWEYILNFTMGGAVAAGIHNLKRAGKRELVMSVLFVFATYLGVSIYSDRWSLSSLPIVIMFTLLSMTCVLVLLYNWKRKKAYFMLLYAWMLIVTLVLANIVQYTISSVGEAEKVSKQYLLSDKYNGEEPRELLNQIKEKDAARFYRIDWKYKYVNNSPIIQNYNGVSAYSSILNKGILHFYLHDLKIDMGRESVSRYGTLGNRANLHSLLRAKYVMTDKKHTAMVPYGFIKHLESQNYIVYQNTNPLPFIRTTKQVFSEKDMVNSNVLEREHAMLSGGILADEGMQSDELPNVPNIIDHVEIKTAGAEYQDNVLTVTKKNGGIDLIIHEQKPETEDYYVGFHLENLAENQGFALKVNKYRTTRKSNRSIYKTYVDDLMIRVPKEDKIKIRLPEGRYLLRDLTLYEEDYRMLEKVKKQSAKNTNFTWIDNKITIKYENLTKDRYMILPIPYEKGWEVEINNERTPIEKINYAFLGFPLKEGTNSIELVYYPPFFWISLAITSLSIALGIFLIWITRKRNYRRAWIFLLK